MNPPKGARPSLKDLFHLREDGERRHQREAKQIARLCQLVRQRHRRNSTTLQQRAIAVRWNSINRSLAYLRARFNGPPPRAYHRSRIPISKRPIPTAAPSSPQPTATQTPSTSTATQPTANRPLLIPTAAAVPTNRIHVLQNLVARLTRLPASQMPPPNPENNPPPVPPAPVPDPNFMMANRHWLQPRTRPISRSELADLAQIEPNILNWVPEFRSALWDCRPENYPRNRQYRLYLRATDNSRVLIKIPPLART